MEENKYLLYSHYGIKENDTSSEIILKSAKKSYMDFCRRVSFQTRVPLENRDTFERNVEKLLSDMIPNLLEVVGNKSGSQELFDRSHNDICEAIIHVYDSAGGQTYGIAQRWLNLTLMNMVVIESNLTTGFFPIIDARKFFHVPVEQYLLEAATTKQKDRFKHGLNLQFAPLKHDKSDDYQMDWYLPGKTQPFENWGYLEYMEFQNAVRSKVKESSMNHHYSDLLDWAFKAFTEVSQARNKWEV